MLIAAAVQAMVPEAPVDLHPDLPDSLRESDVMVTETTTGRRLVVLGTHADSQTVANHLASGVHSLIGLDASQPELQLAIGSLTNGPSFIAANVVRQLAAHRIDTPKPVLSARESEVVRLAARGHTNREIGELLCLSQHTVRSHLQNSSTKLGVRSRTRIAARARDMGIV